MKETKIDGGNDGQFMSMDWKLDGKVLITSCKDLQCDVDTRDVGGWFLFVHCIWLV